jgi:hypothetical protein
MRGGNYEMTPKINGLAQLAQLSRPDFVGKSIPLSRPAPYVIGAGGRVVALVMGEPTKRKKRGESIPLPC